MFLLNTVAENEAQGRIKEGYSAFPEGLVPEPLKLLSASPTLFEMHLGFIQYYRTHKTLSFPLLTAIRFMSADECGHNFCLDFNRKILQMAGMSNEDIDAMKADPASAPLEDKEQAMLVFVTKALKNPKAANQADVDALRAHGWADADIYDALMHGANMVASSFVFNTFTK